ncbi:MAG TPA: hypothetical protein VEJ18_12600 [Planctomycetota bacterium]|nr:hypothetical protein [Planctomycetota bacterium]
MPPYMQIPHYHLSKLPATTKVALTGFSLATFAAILFSALGVYGERTGFETRRVQANFVGDERVAQETGEAMKEMVAEKPKRHLYDIVHPHSFMMPLIYFVLTHMMEMSYARRGVKMGLYVAGFLSMTVVTFSPLLISWRIGAAPLLTASVIVMSGVFAIMTLVPPFQMWFMTSPRS